MQRGERGDGRGREGRREGRREGEGGRGGEYNIQFIDIGWFLYCLQAVPFCGLGTDQPEQDFNRVR